MTAELQSWVQIKIHRKGFHKMWIQRLTSYQSWILFYLRGSKELSTEKNPSKKVLQRTLLWPTCCNNVLISLGTIPSLTPPPTPPEMLCTKKDSFPSISFTSEHCLWWESLKFYWYHCPESSQHFWPPMQFEFNVEVKHFYAVNDMELIYGPYSNNCFETIVYTKVTLQLLNSAKINV